ncbi:hypothetical protein SARC_06364 [Sphaeroforma arctica JP610]|uniref:Uncharacterized protein n=1 Tax=Sphaeroforma arctica JP610 TaxID=667725 RepID=A0A0L0FXC1_9EUKA|nr:hypothetical protein SARC_06364 [Sphaeroforma arctica JP610]KNC81294.1 hypothetical protein SARC_06364 [Sphaeroforma arctica JP610]|eukprot:XP_014155196.1 hypothetical protein SARC_06364 [Sphaeroforma arctica JP610]
MLHLIKSTYLCISYRQQAWDWLIDCYRLRVDDSYVYGGELRGVYDPAHTGRTVSDDFLLFCKLAVKHGVIPDLGQNWGWDGFLKLALGMIPYAFEKSDAHEKYSAKNRDFKFNPMLPVLLTMRFVGARVYGFDLTGQGAENAKDFQELSALIERSGSVYNEKGAPDDLYMEVGGESGWDELRAGITPYYDAEERENGDFDEWRFN